MKRTLNEVKEILMELDNKYGVKTAHLPILHNSRLKNSLGRCHYDNNKPTKFDFSTLTLNLEYDAFKQIVMHEWSHAYTIIVHNEKGHGKNFKATCQMIGCDNDGTKFIDVDSLKVAKANIEKTVKPKYAIVCTHCGYEHKMTRKSQAFKVLNNEMFSIGSYYCGCCKEKNTLVAKNL